MEPETHLPHTDAALYDYHVGALAPEEQAGRRGGPRTARRDAGAPGAAPVELVEAEPPEHISASAEHRQRLVPTGEALVEQAEREPRLVALDADLRKDCGLVEFHERFPERFFECGIAEQDMVSQAGAMALAGLIPAVHSFACFPVHAAERADLQQRHRGNPGSSTPGSLARARPGRPRALAPVRPRHLGSRRNAGMALIEPFSEHEVRAAVAWAVERSEGSVYIRLVSVPWAIGFEPPAIEELVPGRGTVLRAGAGTSFSSAPVVMVGGARQAADLLAADGIEAGVISMPWLRGWTGPGWRRNSRAERPS